MTKRILAAPGAIFTLVFLWRVFLLLFSAQPVPSNDAFFYDGPVVNLLLHGKYANPALALALPISGTEVFCAYPPVYQLVLLGWMRVFGASALSAMALHVVLFGICLLLMFGILRRLNMPSWSVQIGGLFLFVITFHDRPDSLAHLFGLATIYSWTRAWMNGDGGSSIDETKNAGSSARMTGWTSAMVLFSVLSLATGLQIGGLYFLVLWTAAVFGRIFFGLSFPWKAMLALTLIPIVVVGSVVVVFPHLWAGFMEHARQTPSLTGLRVPTGADLLKMIRTAPGILAVAALLRGKVLRTSCTKENRLCLILFACLVPSLLILAASMFVLTANSVFFVSFLQPLIVAAYLGTTTPKQADSEELKHASQRIGTGQTRRRLTAASFVALAALGAIRALGMTSWGLACAGDVNYTSAISRVSAELSAAPLRSAVALSSPYLYEAARHDDVRWLHSDWLTPAQRGGPNTDLQGLLSVRPSKLILTQFDFFRRYQPVLAQLQAKPDVVQMEITNTARIPAPDKFPAMQKIVQNISWAPVVVSFSWK